MPPGGAENTIDPPTSFVTIDFRLNLWINDLMMDATLTNEEEHSSYIVKLQKKSSPSGVFCWKIGTLASYQEVNRQRRVLFVQTQKPKMRCANNREAEERLQ